MADEGENAPTVENTRGAEYHVEVPGANSKHQDPTTTSLQLSQHITFALDEKPEAEFSQTSEFGNRCTPGNQIAFQGIQSSQEATCLATNVSSPMPTASSPSPEQISDHSNVLQVLDPNHPLMKRFQAALKEHLTSQLNLTREQLHVTIHKLQLMTKQRVEAGAQLYIDQQQLAKQQAELESLSDQLNEAMLERLRKESSLSGTRNDYRRKAQLAFAAQAEAAQLRRQVDDVCLQVTCTRLAGADVKSDAQVMKTASRKTGTMVLSAEKEKMAQDFLVDNLVVLVDARLQELNTYDCQTASQREQTRKHQLLLQEFLLEMEALQSDASQITKQWNSAVLGMRRRDEAKQALVETTSERRQTLKAVQAEVESLRRRVLDAEEQQERLMHVLGRAAADSASSRRQLARTHAQLEDMRSQHARFQRLLLEAEAAQHRSSADKRLRQEELRLLQLKYSEGMEAVRSIRLRIMDTLTNRDACLKSAKHTRRLADKVMGTTKSMEHEMEETENALALVEQELIDTDIRLTAQKEELRRVQTLDDDRKKLIINYERLQADNMLQIDRKQTYLDHLNKRLYSLLQSMQGEELSPLENTVSNLEKAVVKEKRDMLDDETLWMELQLEYLSLLREKQVRQMTERDLRRQMMVLQAKQKKLEGCITMEFSEKTRLEREMNHLRVEAEKVALLRVQQVGVKDELSTENKLLENSFVQELKVAERAYIEMQAALFAVREEKESLLNTMLEMEKQADFWSRKIQIGVEMREAVLPRGEHAQECDGMRREIHRMEVRFQSLMKEQEKIIRGMEDVVARRSFVASQRFVASRAGGPDTVAKVKRACSDLRNKVVKAKQEIAAMDEELQRGNAERGALGVRLEEVKIVTDSFQRELATLDGRISRASLVKRANLHEVVARQRRTTRYRALLEQYQRTQKSEARATDRALGIQSVALAEETQRMESLWSVAEMLRSAHPAAAASLDYVFACYGLRHERVRRSAQDDAGDDDDEAPPPPTTLTVTASSGTGSEADSGAR